MNREIKFRGKHIDSGEWIYGDLIQWTSQGRCAIVPQDGMKWDNVNDFEVDPKTVGQFTGLKDKNGKEIYENDVIKDGEGIAVVYYTPPAFTAVDRENKVHLLAAGMVQVSQLENTEVIGNIWENPSLLHP